MVKTIDVNAKEWFDKVNGNSYFSGEIITDYGTDNQQVYEMPFQYGYGRQYEDEATNVLNKIGVITDDKVCLSTYCREHNIILRTYLQKNCKKRDLKNQ